VAHPQTALPSRPQYSGLGPPTLPCYRTATVTLAALSANAGQDQFREVTRRQGSKGPMTSHLRVLTVCPAGKQSLRTDYWLTNLPATTPVLRSRDRGRGRRVSETDVVDDQHRHPCRRQHLLRRSLSANSSDEPGFPATEAVISGPAPVCIGRTKENT
jgi:hypothetical protein